MSDYLNNFEPVIGLEIHIQLNTKSKMFSATPNDTWQAPANSHVSPVEMGLPGALPVPNQQAIIWTQQLGKALNCKLNSNSKFDRKNYFYPDLPKGYQISQYDQPFCQNGFLDISTDGVAGSTNKKRIRIRRIHLEEDTGKSIHQDGVTMLDFNKAGTPLVELVTEPDFASADEASEFGQMVQAAVRKLGISKANMEEGNLRLEANISLRPLGTTELPPYRVELKNINSFKFMRDAIAYEFDRQSKLLSQGEILKQETRGWNERKGISVLQRVKEEESDYRYFPEPDIPPFVFTDEYFSKIATNLPEMPWTVEKNLLAQGVRADYATLLAYDEERFGWYTSLISDNHGIDAAQLATIVANSSTYNQSKEQVSKLTQPTDVVNQPAVEETIVKVLTEQQKAVVELQNGKTNVRQFLIGQVMKELKGQADPLVIGQIIDRKINF